MYIFAAVILLMIVILSVSAVLLLTGWCEKKDIYLQQLW